MPQHLASALPQRGNVLQPRVAAEPLPWVYGVINYPINPNGVVYACTRRPVKDTTPLGLIGLHGRFPSVATKPQRWAGRWNPVGIPEGPPTKANPIGVAFYQLQSKLPGEFKGKLPRAKQLASIARAEMDEGEP